MRLRLAVLVASVLTIGACAGDVDRDSYVQRNEAIRKSLPAFPGATMISVEHNPNRVSSDAFEGRIVSYGTGVCYRVHAGTRPREVADFYQRRLKGWRVARNSPTARWFVRGKASIAVVLDDLLPGVRDNPRGKGGRIFHVGIDHNYYGTREARR
jgi:hypothetical protein